MRLTVLALVFATPAAAWETTVGRVCTLAHDAPQASVRLTYDPAVPEYSITVTRTGDWRPEPVFSIAFQGPAGLTISTNRHQIQGPSVSVTDSGFGNVLNGLEFNETATAILGSQAVSVSLAGAAEPVQAFRACTSAPTA